MIEMISMELNMYYLKKKKKVYPKFFVLVCLKENDPRAGMLETCSRR